jgi:hypothetical protein
MNGRMNERRMIPPESSSVLMIVEVFSGGPSREAASWAYGASVTSNRILKFKHVLSYHVDYNAAPDKGFLSSGNYEFKV